MIAVLVGLVQHDIVWEDTARTVAHVTPLVERAAGAGARLVVLSEMFATGFSLDAERVAEPMDGPAATFLADTAGRLGVWLCGSIPTLDPSRSRPTNRLILAGPAGERHHYDKIHPFSYGGEHERYDAGSELVTVAIDGLSVSLFVCYDLRFADEFWRLAPATDCYVVVANWPAARREHWRVLLQARAIENQAYVVGVNRVGHGGGLDYSGDSMAIGPFGEILADGAGGAETVLLAEIDPDHVRQVRTDYPFLADRR
ncbi:MAG: carbon-nitrogen family hydrolase [Acidimicrobiales bacterium]|nr:carbon-nitrogen family hydrolase [Acidimicrobiales bacterium]